MENVVKLKKQYNKVLDRNKKAEEYLKTHTVQECLKKMKLKNGRTCNAFDLFNDITRELSSLIIRIQVATYRNITKEELFNGFEEVR